MRSLGLLLITVLVGALVGDLALQPDPATARPAQPELHLDRDDLAAVESAFRDEAMDPRWSPAMASALEAALVATSDSRPMPHGIECRSHSCRIVIAEDAAGHADRIVPEFVQRVGQDLPRVVAGRVPHDRGATTTVLYLSRHEERPAMATRAWSRP